MASAYDMTVTLRVYFAEYPPDYPKSPQAAINEGAERAASLMGWYAAHPTDDTIHFHRGSSGSTWADVVYEEKPVPMDYAPGMSDDA